MSYRRIICFPSKMFLQSTEGSTSPPSTCPCIHGTRASGPSLSTQSWGGRAGPAEGPPAGGFSWALRLLPPGWSAKTLSSDLGCSLLTQKASSSSTGWGQYVIKEGASRDEGVREPQNSLCFRKVKCQLSANVPLCKDPKPRPQLL